jgi:uncharacterized membrane protein
MLKVTLLQLMFIFACCSILGYVVEQLLYFLSGNAAKRGTMTGPWGPLYGIGGCIVIVVLGPHLTEFYQSLVFLSVFAAALNFLTICLIRLILGTKLWRYSSTLSILAGFLSIILTEVLQIRIQWLLNHMPLPLLLGFLIAFYVLFVCDLVDTLAAMFTFRKTLRNLRADAQKAADAGLLESADEEDHLALVSRFAGMLAPYVQWLKGYPKFFEYVSGQASEALGRGLGIEVLRDAMPPKLLSGRKMKRRHSKKR